jgi:hypothetical protein
MKQDNQSWWNPFRKGSLWDAQSILGADAGKRFVMYRRRYARRSKSMLK